MAKQEDQKVLEDAELLSVLCSLSCVTSLTPTGRTVAGRARLSTNKGSKGADARLDNRMY